MLRVERLTAGHGQLTVLREITFTVASASVATVVGPNGAGKTTLVHTIAGLLRSQTGGIHHNGIPLHERGAHRVARAGVALVPQGRRVFASLTVAEHLHLASRPGAWTTERVLDVLPALRPLLRRSARHLSGGEQQQLAIARALATNPSLLLLDEPTEGLAPTLSATVADVLTTLAAQGVTILTTAPDTQPTIDAQRTIDAKRTIDAQVIRLHADRNPNLATRES